MIAFYARQSVERENSVSIETQLDFCKAALKPDERRLACRTYVDEGCSGGNTNREGFRNMMRDIELGKITKVVTYKLDRISRSLNDFVGILQTFQEHHVEFVSSQESFDTSSIYGDLILKILIVFAEFERTSIINRVRDAYAKRTDMGLYMGGRRQYGFQLEDTVVAGIPTKQYRPVPEELRQVRYLYDLYAQEPVSLRQAQAGLLERGIKPCAGKDWTTAKLSALLKNPVYVKADGAVYDYYRSHGVRIVNPLEEFDGGRAAMLYGRTTHNASLTDWSDMKLVLTRHEGIIPSDTWLRCRKKLERNRQVGRSINNPTSWLAGKPICAKCGHTMTTIKSRRSDGSFRRYFNCTGKSHKKTCTGVNCTVYAEDLEALADSYIAERLKTTRDIARPVSTENAAEIGVLRQQITEIEEQERSLGNLLAAGGVNDALLEVANQKAADLQRRKRALLAKIDGLRGSAAEAGDAVQFFRKWKKASYSEKKAVADVLIRQMILYEDGTPEIIWND